MSYTRSLRDTRCFVTADIIVQTLERRKPIFDTQKILWERLLTQIMSEGGSIIAVRGAGSINGMDKTEADLTLSQQLIPRILLLRKKGKVTILYDGDEDNPKKPDVGYIVGRLLGYFGNNTANVLFVAIQKQEWYKPAQGGALLTNAYGNSYVTYVFDESDGYNHSDFSQDSALVALSRYQQWYVGASGNIAAQQLIDFNKKVPQGGTRYATLFRVRNNAALDAEIKKKLGAAYIQDQKGDIDKFEAQLVQREHPYGIHWTDQGDPNAPTAEYSRLKLTFVVPVLP